MTPFETTLVVDVLRSYGNLVVYPVNDQAKRVAALAGTKTLTTATLMTAKEMGFTLSRRHGEPLVNGRNETVVA